jgi:transposase
MDMEGDMSEDTVPKRRYNAAFRTEAVWPAESGGGHEAVRRLGMPNATLNNWCRRQRDAPGKEVVAPTPNGHARRSPTDLEAENSRLRKELASAKLDVEILRKETAYVAKDSR